MNESELKRLLERLDAEAGRADAFDGNSPPTEKPISPAEEAGWRRLGAAMNELREANEQLRAPSSVAANIRARLGLKTPDRGVVPLRSEKPAGAWRHMAAAAAMLAIVGVSFTIAMKHSQTPPPNGAVAESNRTHADSRAAEATGGDEAQARLKVSGRDEAKTLAGADKFAEQMAKLESGAYERDNADEPSLGMVVMDGYAGGLDELSKKAGNVERKSHAAAPQLSAHEFEIRGDAGTLAARRDEVARIVDEIRFGSHLTDADAGRPRPAAPAESNPADDPSTRDDGESGPGSVSGGSGGTRSPDGYTESIEGDDQEEEGIADMPPAAEAAPKAAQIVIADYVATMTRREYAELVRRIERNPSLRELMQVAPEPVAEPAPGLKENEKTDTKTGKPEDGRQSRGQDSDAGDLPDARNKAGEPEQSKSEERVQVRIRFIQSN